MFLFYIKISDSQAYKTLSNYFNSFLSTSSLPKIHSPSPRYDQYSGSNLPKASKPSEPLQDKSTKPLCEAAWKAIRGTGVVLIAIIVTSSLMAGSVGIAGIAVAIGAGILAGTAFGALTNAMTCMVTGNWSEFGSKTFEDFKSSCICAISTAAGCGVARLITGSGQAAAQASVNRRLWGNVASGITNSTVSTSASTCLAYKKAREDFKEYLKQNNLENCSNEEKVKLYQDFLQQNGLGIRNIAKTFGFAIITSAIGRNIGSRFQISREAKVALHQGMERSRSQALKSILLENTILTGVGLGSGTLEHGDQFTLENKLGTAFGNYAFGMTSHISSNYAQPKIQPQITKNKPP